MMPLFVATIGVAILASYLAQTVPVEDERAREVRSGVSAVNFLVYRSAVAAYSSANPAATGTIADGVLTFPLGYVRDARWTNVISDNALYVYSPGSIDVNFFDAVYRRSGKTLMVGKASATGTFTRLVGGDSGFSLPASIPAGALVFIGK